MRYTVKSPFRRRHGFTFLEIMLVVMIIGLLASIVGPRIVGVAGQSRVKTTRIALQSLSTALKMAEMDLGRFPTTTEGLAALVERPNGIDPDQYDGPYIEEGAPPTDAWGRRYVYICPSERTGHPFDLFSVGPDGQPGTADDIGA